MRRVVVLGTAGSGKTTLARELARRMGVPHVELDALHWGPNWTGAPREEFRRRVSAAIAPQRWTLDGNYAAVRDLTLARADTIVWLDYPMSVVFTRCLRRTLARGLRGELLWADNRESLWLSFCSSESILLWVIQTWRKHRRDYPRLLRRGACRHARVVRLRSQAETDRWLAELEGRASSGDGSVARVEVLK